MTQRYDEFGGIPLDPLTSLYRLGAGGPSLTTVLAAAGATQRQVALLHVDVDGFAAINTNLGELIGDQALAAVAQRLRKAMPAMAGCGGWAATNSSPAIGYRREEPDGTTLAERLRDAFEAPLSIPPYTMPVSLSIGIALYPDDAHDAAALLAKAEQALRKAKRDVRTGIGLHSLQTGHRRVRRISLAQFSRRDGTQRVPVVLPAHGQRRRRQHRRGQRASALAERTARADPAEPLPRTGRSRRAVGAAWLLGRAHAQASNWPNGATAGWTTSTWPCTWPIRCSSAGLRRPDRRSAAPNSTCPAARWSSRSPKAHSRSMRATSTTRSPACARWRDGDRAGFRRRRAGLAALAQYPLDRLKIDRSFIRNVTSDPRSAAIVRGIIAMGHRLGMKVIAKGVETEAELGLPAPQPLRLLPGPPVLSAAPAAEAAEMIRKRFLLPRGLRRDESRSARCCCWTTRRTCCARWCACSAATATSC
jgi:diguanylate cyclase (GGDEF)-like protein